MAIITPFGLWEFFCMPFGLHNTGQTFHQLMNVVLQGSPFAFCYLDDVLVTSPNPELHLDHFHAVFTHLHQYGLIICLEKCVVCVL